MLKQEDFRQFLALKHSNGRTSTWGWRSGTLEMKWKRLKMKKTTSYFSSERHLVSCSKHGQNSGNLNIKWPYSADKWEKKTDNRNSTPSWSNFKIKAGSYQLDHRQTYPTMHACIVDKILRGELAFKIPAAIICSMLSVRNSSRAQTQMLVRSVKKSVRSAIHRW